MDSTAAVGVFFSHNADDKEQLKVLADRLIHEYDIPCWLDQWNLAAGKAWEEDLQAALRECRACAVFLGPSGWGEYHLREALILIGRAESQADFIAIPVLLPGATEEDIQQAGDFFRSRQCVLFRGGINDEEAFHALRRAIGGESQGPPAMSLFSIRRDAQRWDKRAHEVSALYRGRQLQHAQEMVAADSDALDNLTAKFLTASAAEEQRVARSERKRNRIIMTALSLLAVALGIAALVALRKAWDAADQAFVADKARVRSDIDAGTARRQSTVARDQSAKAECSADEARFQAEIAAQKQREAEDNLTLAERRRREAEKQTRLALAASLIDNGQRVFEERPLLAARLMLEALHYAGNDDSDLTQRALASLTDVKHKARLLKLSAHVPVPLMIPGTSLFVFNRGEGTSEIRRLDDDSLVSALPGRAVKVKIVPDTWLHDHSLPVFLRIDYADHDPELRSIDGTRVFPLAGKLRGVYGGLPDPFFLVTYTNAPSELWRSKLPHEITKLSGSKSADLTFAQNSSLFLIRYGSDPPYLIELRRTLDASLMQQFTPACWISLTGVNRAHGMVELTYDADLTHGEIEVRRMSDGAIVPPSEVAGIAFEHEVPDKPNGRDGYLIRTPYDTVETVFDPEHPIDKPRLRRKDNGRIIELPESPTVKVASPDGASAILGRAMIRSEDDHLTLLPDNPCIWSAFSPDSRVAVICYSLSQTKAQLRRANGDLIADLNGDVRDVSFSRSGSTFFVRYEKNDSGKAIGEWRASADGRILAVARNVDFIPNTDAALVVRDIGTAEIWRDDGVPRRIATLDMEPGALLLGSEQSRGVIWYAKGDAYLLDLAWSGLPDDAEVIERNTCRLFSPAFLREDDVSQYLLGQPPLACR